MRVFILSWLSRLLGVPSEKSSSLFLRPRRANRLPVMGPSANVVNLVVTAIAVFQLRPNCDGVISASAKAWEHASSTFVER